MTALELVAAGAGPTIGMALGAFELGLRRRHLRPPARDEAAELAALRERYATSDEMTEDELELATFAIVDPAGYAALLRRERELEQARPLPAPAESPYSFRGGAVDPAADREARRAARERERWRH